MVVAGQGRRCARALPLQLASAADASVVLGLCPRSWRYELAAQDEAVAVALAGSGRWVAAAAAAADRGWSGQEVC